MIFIKERPEIKTYVIFNKRTNLYKIGRSRNPKKRLKDLEDVKDDCELLIVLDHDCEKVLHATFFDKSEGNEWFSLNEIDLGLIVEYNTGTTSLMSYFKINGINIGVLKRTNYVSCIDIMNLFKSVGNKSTSKIYSYLKQKEGIELSKEIEKNQMVQSLITINGSVWIHAALAFEIIMGISSKIKLELYEAMLDERNISKYVLNLAIIEGKQVK